MTPPAPAPLPSSPPSTLREGGSAPARDLGRVGAAGARRPRAPSLGRKVVVGALRWALLPAVTFALGAVASGRRAEATPEQASPYAMLGQLGRVLVHIENSYVDPVDRTRLVDGAIKGMVEELDPHSGYLRPEEWKLFQSDTEGRFGGVGIEVDGKDNELVVIAPIEGSPAERAGIKSGDRIVSVDGADVRGQGLDKVVKRMRGAIGTKVKLGVRRDKQTLTFELVRETIHVTSVTHKLLAGNVGYVRIKQFQEGTHGELLRAAGKLRAEAKGGKLSGVLLDMRSDPGGLVDEATECADEFLGQGGNYSMRRRGQIIEEARARSGGAFADVPVVALVNEWSASAAELLVGALQDNKRATVVGVNTFGKGSVQTILELPMGAGLKLTTARYYTPSGHAIQADGIHPDVVVEAGRTPDAPQVTREKDLPGHLPAEGSQGAGARGSGAAPTAGDAGAGPAVSSDLARDVPADPAGSSDVVLRTGYQILMVEVQKRPAR